MKLDERIKEYARLAIRKGLNVQEGQEVIINANLDQPDFIELLVKEAYEAKARRVIVNWNNDRIKKLAYEYETVESLSVVRSFELDKLKWQCENLPAVLHVLSDDPNVFSDVNQDKVSAARKNMYPLIKPYRDRMENKYQWCIIGVPSLPWAKEVFPGLSDRSAIQKLWKLILDCSRVKNDAVLQWERHNRALRSKCRRLNRYKFDYLHYRSAKGTDLKIWLHEDGIFIAGSEKTLGSNIEFNPNIPTEEVFTSPIAGRADGIVYSTKPLIYNGERIDEFAVTFKDGKVTKTQAKVGEKLLNTMVSMDEGARRLGEVALVPITSPINVANTLFYETLYDENAACHLALGRGFDPCIKNYEKYTQKELEKKGINDSIIHVDFMIGDETLDIDGYTRDGKVISVFRAGKWAL